MKPEFLRSIFLVVFMVSTGILVLFIFGPTVGGVFSGINSSLASGTDTPAIVPTSVSNDIENPPPIFSGNVNSGVLIGSVMTSITSLIGFVTTTVISWRKEKREASLADVQRKKLETELEKSRLELERLKKSKPKRKTKK